MHVQCSGCCSSNSGGTGQQVCDLGLLAKIISVISGVKGLNSNGNEN